MVWVGVEIVRGSSPRSRTGRSVVRGKLPTTDLRPWLLDAELRTGHSVVRGNRTFFILPDLSAAWLQVTFQRDPAPLRLEQAQASFSLDLPYEAPYITERFQLVAPSECRTHIGLHTYLALIRRGNGCAKLGSVRVPRIMCDLAREFFKELSIGAWKGHF